MLRLPRWRDETVSVATVARFPPQLLRQYDGIIVSPTRLFGGTLGTPVHMTTLPPDPSWHHDAIIYQLHVKAFRDANRDGFGDFRGLLEKLDYIASLGVTAVWLLPFYPSPLKDDGYDIA